jgi:nucleotide-binding universal stress UspA family protein
MSIKKMVVAYDGSEGSQKALTWAVDLAVKLNSDVVVVAVVKPLEFTPSVVLTVVKPFEFSTNRDEVDKFYSDGEKYYRPLLEKAVKYGEAEGVALQTEILHGHPSEVIVQYAYDCQADLIVMGTRGMGGFESLIIGSVAQKVVTYSKVPVVLMK